MIPLQNEIADLENKLITQETGEWTPTLEVYGESNVAPDITYTYSQGLYTKIGNLVFVKFQIRGSITALNGTNNYACIKGLPFKVKSKQGNDNPLSLGQIQQGLSSTSCTLFAYNTYIKLMNITGTANLSWVTCNACIVSGAGCYITEE